MNEDHKEIYLEPDVPEMHELNEGRQWCHENIWHKSDYDGVEATKYIRSDLASNNRQRASDSTQKKEIELTADEIEIFGKPNFAAAPIARLLIAAGFYKDGGNKAEYEQAVFIHWASRLLNEHGDNWKIVACGILDEKNNEKL